MTDQSLLIKGEAMGIEDILNLPTASCLPEWNEPSRNSLPLRRDCGTLDWDGQR